MSGDRFYCLRGIMEYTLLSTMFDQRGDEEHWYALKVFYNRVFEVERLLAQEGVKSYIPLRCVETTVGGRTIRRREPAVSSLMFVRGPEQYVLELTRRLKNTTPLMTYFDRDTRKPGCHFRFGDECFHAGHLDRRSRAGISWRGAFGPAFGRPGCALRRVRSKVPRGTSNASRATGA